MSATAGPEGTHYPRAIGQRAPSGHIEQPRQLHQLQREPASPGGGKHEVDSAIMCSGFTHFDSANKPEWGFGTYPDVVTTSQVEQMISSGQGVRFSVVSPNVEPTVADEARRELRQAEQRSREAFKLKKRKTKGVSARRRNALAAAVSLRVSRPSRPSRSQGQASIKAS